MTDPAAGPPAPRKTPGWLTALLWILGVLLVLLTGLLLMRRPFANMLAGRASYASVNGDAHGAVQAINLSKLLAPADLQMDILYLRYQYLEQAGDIEGALRDLASMIQQDPGFKNGSPYPARGLLFLKLKRYDEAIADFEAAIRWSQSRPFIEVQLGHCHRGKGDWEAAKRHYQAAEAAGVEPWSKSAREALQKLP